MSDQEQKDKTPDEIREEIAATREELGDTVEALGAKSDVKGRAQAKVEDVKADAKAKVTEVKEKVTPSGDGDGSGPAATVQQGGQAAADTVKSNPLPFAVAAALLIGYLIGRRGGNR
jgi:ElaB/YqjD/DUF883 family membrane-anchored ribosome-binding protein